MQRIRNRNETGMLSFLLVAFVHYSCGFLSPLSTSRHQQYLSIPRSSQLPLLLQHPSAAHQQLRERIRSRADRGASGPIATVLAAVAGAADSSSSAQSKDDYKFKIRELFWVTPEALNIEVLISRGKKQLVRISRIQAQQQPTNATAATTAAAATTITATVAAAAWTWSNFLVKIAQRFFSGLYSSWERPRAVRRPPLLFVHGSFHSAWCFSEQYMEYFSRLGHDCYAISLRGTAATSMPPENPGDTVRIEQHVYDVTFALNVIRKFYEDEMNAAAADGSSSSSSNRNSINSSGNIASSSGYDSVPAPVIIAHSFGGLVAMKLLEQRRIRESVSGVALLCSVPPSGNAPMTQRLLQRDFLAAMRIVWGFVLKGATFNPSTCKELFFDNSVPKEDINRYMRQFRADSRVGLDLAALDAVLPSKVSATAAGVADWIEKACRIRTNRNSSSSADAAANDAKIFALPSEQQQQQKQPQQQEQQQQEQLLTTSTAAESRSSDEVSAGRSAVADVADDLEIRYLGNEIPLYADNEDHIDRISTDGINNSSNSSSNSTTTSSNSGSGSGSDNCVFGMTKGTVNGVYLPARLVIGAERDFIVDAEGVRETARYLGLGAALGLDFLRPNYKRYTIRQLPQTSNNNNSSGSSNNSSSSDGNSSGSSEALQRQLQRLDAEEAPITRRAIAAAAAAAAEVDGSSGAVFVRGAYHDVMLGPKWKRTAVVLAQWLSSI